MDSCFVRSTDQQRLPRGMLRPSSLRHWGTSRALCGTKTEDLKFTGFRPTPLLRGPIHRQTHLEGKGLSKEL